MEKSEIIFILSYCGFLNSVDDSISNAKVKDFREIDLNLDLKVLSYNSPFIK